MRVKIVYSNGISESSQSSPKQVNPFKACEISSNPKRKLARNFVPFCLDFETFGSWFE